VVTQINGLSSFAAGINRLETFEEALDAQSNPPTVGTTVIDTAEKQRRDTPISLEHVTLMTPKGQRMLVSDLSAELEPGKGLVIVGQSGAGKSSLLRAIAGLWNTGTGRITRPDLAQMLFLPQRPYMVLGTLRDQLLYPNLAADADESQLRQALQQVNLADLPERVGGFNVELIWADVLSLGEQQRLAFARLLLSKPPYVVLDEATSALDLSNEKRLYDRLRESAATFISVGHRPSLLKYHDYVLELTGDTHWNLTRAEDYTATDQVFS
jgi:vitamin B12/bleomycin/antimicrobial peptide transport system ATP-binding/permease protein